jgi:hypothetical protein
LSLQWLLLLTKQLAEPGNGRRLSSKLTYLDSDPGCTCQPVTGSQVI